MTALCFIAAVGGSYLFGRTSTLYTLLNAAEQGGIWLYGYYYKTERAEDPGESIYGGHE